MSLSNQKKVISEYESSKIAIGFLAVMVVFGLFVVGYDQGHIFSIVEGSDAFNAKYLHEFTHDLRHSAGFPCH